LQNGLYVALSAQIAMERRLTTIADNIANANTTGFRATGIKFESVMAGSGTDNASFVTPGDTFLMSRSGETVATGNPLDFAIEGDAWFAISTPQGMVMTRDGRFSLKPTGELVTVNGYPVLDPGGAPIELNPAGGTPVVGRDGFLRQDGAQVGALGLFEFQPGPNFQRFENSGVMPETPPEPIVDRNDAGVQQGFLESSNVNAIQELTSLIKVQRTFDDVAALVRDGDDALDSTIRALDFK
jgi:flagellar basal-body rod protein FlgF